MEQNTLTGHTDKDIICAISTPPGTGGIAVIRISGPGAMDAVDAIWRGHRLADCPTHTAHLGYITDSTGEILDQAVATIFRGPKSYTSQDTIEISVHGSMFVQKAVIEALTDIGIRLAEPGEFTRRAFVNGNIDLTQAEGVADLLAARSRAAHRLAIAQLRGSVSTHIETLRQRLIDLAALLELELDFSEEDVEFAERTKLINTAEEVHREVTALLNTYRAGNAIKNGIPLAIVGPTNAGKSSLLNAILGDERAIVSDIHGTTRDIVEDTFIIGDQLYRLKDTAGLRHTEDTIEQIGIQRTLRALAEASIAILVLDPFDPDLDDTVAGIRQHLTDIEPAPTIIVVINKTDIADRPAIDNARTTIAKFLPDTTTIEISANTHYGIGELLTTIAHAGDSSVEANADIIITNARHVEDLRNAAEAAADTIAALRAGIPTDLVAQHLRATIQHLSAITGNITSTTLLTHIFSHFCIGK